MVIGYKLLFILSDDHSFATRVTMTVQVFDARDDG